MNVTITKVMPHRTRSEETWWDLIRPCQALLGLARCSVHHCFPRVGKVAISWWISSFRGGIYHILVNFSHFTHSRWAHQHLAIPDVLRCLLVDIFFLLLHFLATFRSHLSKYDNENKYIFDVCITKSIVECIKKQYKSILTCSNHQIWSSSYLREKNMRSVEQDSIYDGDVTYQFEFKS